MLSFTVAHISIIGLRLRDPGRDRPYRAPWNVPIGGRPVPLTAVLGAMGTGAAFISVVILHTEARYVGTAWMVAGMTAYFLYRRRQGLDPRLRYRIERPQRPLGFYGVAYHSALVPIFGTDVSTEAMARAAKLVGPDAEIEALYVLMVPRELELDQGLEEEEELGRNVLEVARLQARARRLKVRARLIRTRNPGATIVEEATERHSDLIYISTQHAPSSERLLGPTTRYVLANRPCRIVIEGGNARSGSDFAPQASPPAARHTPARGRDARAT
jgi:APA family basic amino acid/polyamine antiporter